MIKRVRNANARSFHNCKARRIDRRKLMQIRSSEIFPRLVQIAQLAGKDLYASVRVNGFPPHQGHVSVGITIEEGECFEHNWDGRVKLRPSAMQELPLFPRWLV